MRICSLTVLVVGVFVASSGAQEVLKYDFNDFDVGPIEGQREWNIYDMVKDSSALSIMDELGTSEASGDKALVIQASPQPIRCVTGEPTRWLPGRTLTVEFDFKVAVDPGEVAMSKPSLTVMVGNALLSPKARFEIGIDAMPNGDWLFRGAMPDPAEKKIYSENFLFRSDQEVSISEWHQFKLVIKKLSEPDTFETSAEIRNAKTGAVLSELSFTSADKGKVSKGVWGSARAHVGFNAPKEMLGLVCVDNLVITSTR